MIKPVEMTKAELQDLGGRIFEYRAVHNLSANKFAKLCNITMPTVYNIENCKQAPSKMTLKKILNVIEKEDKQDETN